MWGKCMKNYSKIIIARLTVLIMLVCSIGFLTKSTHRQLITPFSTPMVHSTDIPEHASIFTSSETLISSVF